MFGFTEVKLGILPAVISPFALAKIGRSAARELFLTGARFSAARAKEIGLVHAVVSAHELDNTVATYVQELLTAGPEAVAAAKALIPMVWPRATLDATAVTAPAIAARRVSAEGQEGLKAFLEKRTAGWVATSSQHKGHKAH
jgi:methylglutaconyl-CoA hydratase